MRQSQTDERVLLTFQDGCPALGAPIFTRAGPLPRGRPRLVGIAEPSYLGWRRVC